MKYLIRLVGGIICIIGLCLGNASAGTFTIPDWLMKSCFFVMKGNDAIGTGFLVGVQDQGRTFYYFVTAKHVILPALTDSNVLHLRLNKKGGNDADIVDFPLINFDGKPWLEHKKSVVDLAVVPLAIGNKINDYDVNLISADTPTNDVFASQSFINRYKIRPGDRAFTLGLVPYLFSKDEKNIVMTRSGSISMIDDHELSLPGGKQKAYFLDSPAFPGQSGGPAFVLLERDEAGALIAGWRFALLGVVTQFVPSPLRFGLATAAEGTNQEKTIPIENTGISKVVPVDYLIEILFSEEQKKFRKVISEEQEKNSKKRSGENKK